MKTKAFRRWLERTLRASAVSLLLFSGSLARGNPVFWNGPVTTYVQNSPDPSDQLTANVAISRLQSGPLFNGVTEDHPDNKFSPADTMWAFGTFEDITNGTVSWQTFADVRNDAATDLASYITNKPMVLHLLSDDIYISLIFTAWGSQGAGGFTYMRTTPNAVANPLTLAITEPLNDAVFAAPAILKISAGVTNGTATVTNVTFFANATTALGSKTNAPYNITTGNLSAGAYALTAVATAGGISITSAAVNVSIVTPITISNSTPQITSGIFSFSYAANPGLKYVVQISSNLLDWTAISTNTAAVNPVHFTATVSPDSNRFYRVGRLPNS